MVLKYMQTVADIWVGSVIEKPPVSTQCVQATEKKELAQAK